MCSMERLRKQKIQYFITASASIATLSLGVTSSWTSPVIAKFHDNETGFDVSEEGISWMAAINNPGFIAGSLVTRYTSDQFGRRATLIGSTLPYAVGSLIAAFAMKVWLLCITRFLWGFGTGMVSTVIGIYIAEVSEKDIRGRLIVCTKLMTNLGNLLIMSIGPKLSYWTLNYMLLLLPVCQFVTCWWIPESPYHLLRLGKVEMAKNELWKLREYKDQKDIEEEFVAIQSSVKAETRSSSSFKELFAARQYRRAIGIAVGLKVTSIMTGGGAIKQYLAPILKETKLNIKTSDVLLIYGLVEFLVSIVSSVLADRIGRRPLLFYSYLGTGVALALSASYFLLQEIIVTNKNSLDEISFLVFLGIILANVISAVGFNSISFAVLGEIFPLNVKTVAMTSLSILGGVVGFVVGKGYQSLKNSTGLFGVFAVFTSVAFIGALFVFFFVIETKGLTLNEIQVKLQGDSYEVCDKNTAGTEMFSLEKEDNDSVKSTSNV